MLHRLLYASSETREFTENELQKLLIDARARNQLLGVTGMLMYGNGAFMQALEGEAESLAELYRSIARDPRHCELVRICYEPIPRRSFGAWTMGFRSVNEAVIQREVPGYLGGSVTHLVSANPRVAETLLYIYRQ